jgi:transposase-like protein
MKCPKCGSEDICHPIVFRAAGLELACCVCECCNYAWFPEQQSIIDKQAKELLEAAELHLADEQSIRNMQKEITRLEQELAKWKQAHAKLLDATYQSHDGHWDRMGTRGANCPECIRAEMMRKEAADIIAGPIPTPEGGKE